MPARTGDDHGLAGLFRPTGAPDSDAGAAVAAVHARIGPGLLAVGGERSDDALHVLDRVVDGWAAAGGDVTDVVTWPTGAASWLRPASRLCRGAPQAWLIVAGATWPPVRARLAADRRWAAEDTWLIDTACTHPRSTSPTEVARRRPSAVAPSSRRTDSWL